jgi:uncharacterized protein
MPPPPPPPPPPADWRDATIQLAEKVHQTLIQVGVAPASLLQENQVPQEDPEARWWLVTLRVEMPSTLTAESLHAQLAQILTSAEVAITKPETDTLLVAYRGKYCVEIKCVPAPLEFPLGPVGVGTPEQKPVPGEPVFPENTKTGDLKGWLNTLLPSLEELPLDSVEQEEGENGFEAAPAPLAAGHVPRIAVILDDGGYNGPSTHRILNELDPHVTLAILPNTPSGRETAELGVQKGFEILLHMPMETHSKTLKPFPGQVNTTMSKEEIQRLTEDAIAQVPGLVGVNNHTGSKFTSDAPHLAMFMEVLKKKSLFFVDSRTLGSSKGYAVAQAMGVPAAGRNIFLDNDSNPAKIRAQFAKLVARAKARGQAIGIGHFRDNTVAVLAEELPKLHDNNVELVHVSELTQ